MRRGVLSQGSQLIKSIGWDNSVMEVEYSDGKVFAYCGVPFQVFKSIVRAHHPGQKLLAVRDKYKHTKV
jgi:hypothetical protein